MTEIAVVKNCLGTEVGAYVREEFADACDVIEDGDAIVMFADGQKIETISGACFKRVYGEN